MEKLVLQTSIRKTEYRDTVQSHEDEGEEREGRREWMCEEVNITYGGSSRGIFTCYGRAALRRIRAQEKCLLHVPAVAIPSTQHRITYYTDNFTSHACSPASVVSQVATRGTHLPWPRDWTATGIFLSHQGI